MSHDAMFRRAGHAEPREGAAVLSASVGEAPASPGVVPRFGFSSS